MSKIITLTSEQVKEHPIITKKGNPDSLIHFYDFIAKYEHIPDNAMIRCTHINIAENIQKAWYDYVREHDLMSDSNFTMLLLMNGPKAVNYLKDNTVELQDDWYTVE